MPGNVFLFLTIITAIASLVIIKTEPLPINVVVRGLSFWQWLCQPVFNPINLPKDFPPIEIIKLDDPYPGTLLFTNATNPWQENVKKYGRYIAEVEKTSGKVKLYMRILTKAYLFQPQPEGYSYGILEKIGVNGAGHDGAYYLTDKNLKAVDKFKVSGVPKGTSDMHEFLRLSNGNALMLSYRTRWVNLETIGGFVKSLVYDPVIVEQTPEQKIVWLWDGKDYLNILDAADGSPDANFNAKPPLKVDYAHANSLATCSDGNILLSMKHMDCVIKINRQTNKIVWVMGGVKCKNNQFIFLNDPKQGFSHQHNVRSLPNGNLLLFDNGTLHSQPESRAVEYEIDEQQKTAKLIWSYSNGQFTPAQGSVERLPNGNTLIGWGFATQPFVSEVTSEKEVVLEMNLPQGQIAYRIYQGSK